MGMGLIVPRSEVEKLREVTGWILIYGRRKTGKTFLVRKFLRYDSYYFISRSLEVFSYNKDLELLSYDIFFDRIKRDIEERKTIVIDEFQRLPQSFLDFLHFSKSFAKSQIILVGSSLSFVNKILSTESPLLGIVYPFRLGLIKPRDIIFSLSKYYSDKECLLLSMFARDPIILEELAPNDNLESFLRKVLPKIRVVVRSLIGEIFTEEERELTKRYEAIIKAVAAGNKKPSEVASFISGMLGEHLKSQDVKKYLKNLVEMNLLKRVKIFGKKAYFYFIDSPIVDLYYYLDLKTGFSELDIPIDTLISKAMGKIPFYYENFVVELLAEIYGCEVVKSFYPEIDGILTRGKQVEAVVKVKMGNITTKEVNKFLEKVEDFDCRKIVVAGNTIKDKKIESMTAEQLVEKLKKRNGNLKPFNNIS